MRTKLSSDDTLLKKWILFYQNVIFVLSIKNLSIDVAGKRVVSGITVSLASGSIHALMGPNGSGKSSLAMALMGHPAYQVVQGEIWVNNQNVVSLSPDKRAQAGLFLAFQYPPAIPGVSVFTFLRESCKSIGNGQETIEQFNARVASCLALLALDHAFLGRSLNDGFSGGERKKMEILQLLLLRPQVAILDEIDSGLDIDALKVVSQGILTAQKQNPNITILMITHYRRILEYIMPDAVHIMQPGREGAISRSGDYSLINLLETKGYDGVCL